MTVKDLAELCMKHGLKCQKYVYSFVAYGAVIDRMYPSQTACRPQDKQSQPSSAPTFNAVKCSKTNPSSFVTSCRERRQTTTSSLHSTPVWAAPIALTQRAKTV